MSYRTAANSEDTSEDEIPCRKPEPKSEDDEIEEDNHEQDEDLQDDGFEVETILGHRVKGKSKLEFKIKWDGYENEEDITWEPEENLATAPEVVNKYFQKHGGRAALLALSNLDLKAGKKRKMEQSSPSYSQKNGRKRVDSEEHQVHYDRKAARFPPGSWENSVANIDYIEEVTDSKTGESKRSAYIHWNDGKEPQHTRHPLHVLNQKCPQKMLAYYEAHLVFKQAKSSPSPSCDEDIKNSDGDP